MPSLRPLFQAARLLTPLLLACTLLTSAPLRAASDADIVRERISTLNTSLQNTRPRLLIRPADIPALRESLLKTLPAQPDTAALARLALAPLDNSPLPPQPLAVANRGPEGTRAWREGYMTASNTGNQAWRYALGWQLTGDPAYGREAARWLLHLASWKIDREVLRTNDELFIQHLRPMIFAWDWAHSALSPEEQATVRSALEARLQLLAEHIQPKFSLTAPTPPDNSLSHPMRFISTLGLGGLALYHDSAAAPAWLAWSYEYYKRQFPVWGGDAGGWAEGLNYWATGMTQHLRFLEAMQLVGVSDALERPFFRNTAWFAAYFQMPYAASSFGDLTNIMAPTPSMALMIEKFALLHQDPYLLRFGRLLTTRYPTAFNYYDYGAIDALLHLFRRGQSRLPEADLALVPHSRHFSDVGWVAMHSRLGDRNADIMLGFKSSPFGSASHSFSDQNSFVLNAFGEPLAISSGYREWYDSPHHKEWTRTTASKNAILIDGQGQPIKSAAARGRISRFTTGDLFTFTTGDAREAYAGRASRALRHIFFIDKRYFVLLDEIASPEAARFQWQLHARERMELTPAEGRIAIRKGQARLDVSFLAPAAKELEMRQTDEFSTPVDPGYQQRMPKEWHATTQTLKPAREQHFFTVLHPSREGVASDALSIRPLPTRRGFAAEVKGSPGTDRIYMSRESDRSIRADGISADALAVWLGERPDQNTRITALEAEALTSQALEFRSNRPLSLEGSASDNLIQLRFLTPPATNTTLQIKVLVAPRSLSGVARTDWSYDMSTSTLTANLGPNTSLLRIVPAWDRILDDTTKP